VTITTKAATPTSTSTKISMGVNFLSPSTP
jgi:hypothetical protein